MYEPKTPLEKEALNQLERGYGMDWYFVPESSIERMVKDRVKYIIKTGDF